MWFLNVVGFLVLLSAVSCDLSDDVKFFLSTEDQNRTELNDDNLDAINVENPIFVLIHGWSVESNTTWVVDLTAELLDLPSDCNVIAVDYTPISQLNYTSAVAASRSVGEYTGEFLANLYANYSASLSDLHIIGHSLGGQIAGFTGKTVQTITGLNISRITGLDPAGPLFFPLEPEERLASSDADIVVALHTDGLVFGYYYQIGGIDFYANGGTAPQPGCLEEDLTSRCSHGRATELYLEAVLNPDGFVATECSDYLLYELGLCSENNNITLGASFTQSEYGKYYFKTNSESPYSQE